MDVSDQVFDFDNPSYSTTGCAYINLNKCSNVIKTTKYH